MFVEAPFSFLFSLFVSLPEPISTSWALIGRVNALFGFAIFNNNICTRFKRLKRICS